MNHQLKHPKNDKDAYRKAPRGQNWSRMTWWLNRKDNNLYHLQYYWYTCWYAKMCFYLHFALQQNVYQGGFYLNIRRCSLYITESLYVSTFQIKRTRSAKNRSKCIIEVYRVGNFITYDRKLLHYALQKGNQHRYIYIYIYI